jgi:hypothetical protein
LPANPPPGKSSLAKSWQGVFRGIRHLRRHFEVHIQRLVGGIAQLPFINDHRVSSRGIDRARGDDTLACGINQGQHAATGAAH